MKSIAGILSLVCGAVVLGAVGCATLHKSDSARLQGTWKGEEIGGGTEGTCCLIVAGKALEFRGATTNEWYKGTFTLREDKNPREVAVVITQCSVPRYIGTTAHGIYRLEGNTLTLTANEPGNPEVPNAFSASSARSFVFKQP